MPSSASRWNVCQRSRRSTGSRPTVGSSRTSTSGRPSRAVASETRERSPPESVWTTWPACAAEATVSIVSSIRARRGAEDPREVTEVFAHGQVGVDGRGLRDVADPPPQRRRARRQATDGDLARLDDLHADDRAHQRRLAGSARPEQAGHGPGRDVQESPGRTSVPPRRTRRSRTLIAASPVRSPAWRPRGRGRARLGGHLVRDLALRRSSCTAARSAFSNSRRSRWKSRERASIEPSSPPSSQAEKRVRLKS